MCMSVAFFVKQKTAYEMRISDWSSDVCSSDRREIDRLVAAVDDDLAGAGLQPHAGDRVLAAAGRIGAALLVELLLAQRSLGRGRLERRFLAFGGENGRASCRESGCQYVEITGVDRYYKKKNKKDKHNNQ